MKLPQDPGKLLLMALITIFFIFPSIAASSELTLAVADSTCDTVKQAGEIFTKRTNIKLNYVCQASGLLVQGIKEGSLPADYFLSASNKWMNAVVESGHVNPKAVRTNWGNQLVVASFPSKTGQLELHGLEDLLGSSVKTIIIGDPDVAPFGMYAKQALINAEMWDKLQAKIKFNPKISVSIRSLKKMSLATPGIVAFLYKTNVSDKMHIHFAVPQHLYPQVSYFSAPLINAEKKNEMALFLDFITGKEAGDIFTSAGFMLNPSAKSPQKEQAADQKSR